MTWKLEVKFGPPTPKKMRTVSPTLALSGVLAGQGADAAVEDDVVGPLVQHLRRSLGKPPWCRRLARVEVALHDVELVVDLGRPSSGSTTIRPYMPLAMWWATIGVAQW